jgi:WD40 repeat protein
MISLLTLDVLRSMSWFAKILKRDSASRANGRSRQEIRFPQPRDLLARSMILMNARVRKSYLNTQRARFLVSLAWFAVGFSIWGCDGQTGSVHVVKARGAPVYKLINNHKGDTLYSADGAGRVGVWKLPGEQAIQSIQCHERAIYAIDIAGDDQILATGSEDHTVRLWSVETNSELKRLTGHQGWVKALVFSPNGLTLASAGADATIKLWDVKKQTEIRSLAGHTGDVNCLCFAENGEYLISGGDDKVLRVWQVSSGRLKRTIPTDCGLVSSMALSRDGETIFVGGSSDRIQALKYSDGEERWRVNVHVSAVRSLVASPGERGLVVAGPVLTKPSGAALVFDMESQREIAAYRETSTTVNCALLLPDKITLVVGSSDGSIKAVRIKD